MAVTDVPVEVEVVEDVLALAECAVGNVERSLENGPATPSGGETDDDAAPDVQLESQRAFRASMSNSSLAAIAGQV